VYEVPKEVQRKSELPNIMALAKKTTEHPHHTPLYSRASNEEMTAWPDIPRRGGRGRETESGNGPKVAPL